MVGELKTGDIGSKQYGGGESMSLSPRDGTKDVFEEVSRQSAHLLSIRTRLIMSNCLPARLPLIPSNGTE